MRLVLPKYVVIGKRRYVVRRDPTLTATALARIHVGRAKLIQITTKPGVSRDEIEEAFWHEITHGVLRDMRHERWADERFVPAFAKRLSSVIKQMRFK